MAFLAGSLIWLTANIQTYIQEVDSPKTKISSTDTTKDSLSSINIKQSTPTKWQTYEHKAEFLPLSIPDTKEGRAVMKKLTGLDVLLLILAWASGVFFSRFAGVFAKQL